MLDLHFWPTPNGKKVTILLEELGVPYRIVPCNIGAGDQFTAEFLAINPNHRMPVLVDHDPVGGGAPISVFESGAIMLYLAEKFGKFLPTDPRGRTQVTEWLIWFLACLGRAIHGADGVLAAVIAKAQFWERAAALALNERQIKILNRLLDGFEGKMTSSKWATIAKCSQDTANRDIAALLDLGLLRKGEAGGRSTSYELTL